MFLLLMIAVLLDLLFDNLNDLSVVLFCVFGLSGVVEMALCFFLHDNVEDLVFWKPNLAAL
jgi:hypothetical protein